MKLNLNIPCKITLTVSGAILWNERYSGVPEKYRPAPSAEGDNIKTQLWCLMETFGPHIHIGMGEVHFKENYIEIDDYDAEA